MRALVGAFLAGMVFGLGLAVSRMIDPAKILGFLDITGSWDPSLALVMVGALLVMAPAYRIAGACRTPFAAESFHLQQPRYVDTRLVVGSIIFGVGWGLVGLCPGPAISALALGRHEVLVFVLAMLAGMAVQRYGPRRTAVNAVS